MRDRILMIYIIVDLVFAASGGVLLAFALISKTMDNSTPTANSIARDLSLSMCPLNAAIANAILIFVVFALSLPSIMLRTTRAWLKFNGYLVVMCSIFSLVLGLTIWFETLKQKANLATVYAKQTTQVQSLVQTEFGCCGYLNSTSPPFAPDDTCPDAATAAMMVGCVTPFTSFANNFLDVVFTGAFGIVGIDVALILATAMLLKDRKEQARYRVIDEKNGTGAF